MLEGVQIRGELYRYLMRREPWDVFSAGFSEAHCAGHHFWKFLNPTHPDYDLSDRHGLGDTVASVYRAIDREIGDIDRSRRTRYPMPDFLGPRHASMVSRTLPSYGIRASHGTRFLRSLWDAWVSGCRTTAAATTRLMALFGGARLWRNCGRGSGHRNALRRRTHGSGCGRSPTAGGYARTAALRCHGFAQSRD